jgi:hypothetical protein
MTDRYFVYVDKKTGRKRGRYHGQTPLQAARKCASKQFQRIISMGGNPHQEITFVIKEVTRCSKKKYFAYKAKRLTLPQYNTVHFGANFQVHFYYRIRICKTKLPYNLSTKTKKIEPNVMPSTTNLEPKINDISNCGLVIEI